MADTIEATYHSSTWQGELDHDGLAWGIYLMYVDDKAVKCKGKLNPDTMQPGLTLELVGKRVTDPKYGKQIAFDTYTRKQPAGRYGVMAFLQQAPNIGSITAEKIYETFGERAIELLIAEPEVVANQVQGLRTEVAQEASSVLATLYGECKHKLPLINLFKGTKIPVRMADQVLRAGIPDAVEKISENPFMLMKFGGTGFKQCDTLRQKLRLDPKMPSRIMAACTQSFKDRSDAVWLPADDVGKRMKELLEFSADGQKAIDRAMEFGMVVQSPDGGPWYALAEQAKLERFVALDLCARMDAKGDWPMKEIAKIPDSAIKKNRNTGISNHQREVILHNMQHGGRIAVLPGPPGTGKTTTLARVLKTWGAHAVVCAPTGKATQRMESVLRQSGVDNITSGTTHKILGAQPRGDGFVFMNQNGEVNPEVLVVDETSMKSNEMGYRLLKGVSRETNIIFLGDAFQLPPVGPGTMFRDLQALRRFQHLTEIHRNEGMIAKACAQIAAGQVPRLHRTSKPFLNIETDTNVHHCIAGKDAGKARYVDKIIEYALDQRIVTDDGPICQKNDLQFLTATHENQSIGRHKLNAVIQSALNPNGGGQHKKYRVGDKVICLKNSTYKTVQAKEKDRTAVDLSNGDLGTVVESNDKTIVVQMEHSPEYLLIPVGAGENSPFFDLGYCITTHKSQGSEWPCVAVVVGDDYGSRRLVDRTWLNTALSRAKHCACLITGSGRLASAVKRDNISARKSYIHYHMKQYHAQKTATPAVAACS
jgi:exodeoxyribonuclease V alpha subunit